MRTITSRHRPPRTASGEIRVELARASAECIRLRTALAQVDAAGDLTAAKTIAVTALQADNSGG